MGTANEVKKARCSNAVPSSSVYVPFKQGGSVIAAKAVIRGGGVQSKSH